ncbi:MAG: serine/threonine protein kinase [Ruminococcus sp.]|nr:serine/threonine protein kinase [Ruminococcus sp.]
MLTRDTIIDNKYKILDEIGHGGMSTVYRATVERSGKIWAVKEVRISETDDKIAKECLQAEIDTLRNLNRSAIPEKIRYKIPEIADIIDNGDNNLIIVMDYIEGVSLDKVIEKKGAQSEEKVVNWAMQLCEVLGYLHSKKIIYRDMKPSNVMLKKNNEVAIIDFGTAKKYEYSGETQGLGTIGFAAPEQHGQFGRTDERTDIYCLGKTMYTLLTGIDPRKSLVIDTSIRKVNPSFSPGLDQIIKKCTQHNPDDRYQSCEELLYYLKEYKEIDKGSRKKKILKVGMFFTSIAICIACGIYGYSLNEQAKALATDTYQELLTQADMIILDAEDNSENSKNKTDEKYNQKINLYTEAISVPDKAGKLDAYLALIETYKEDDNIFTEEELTQLNYLVTQNETALKANPENYIEICYEIGNLLWYYYDDTNQMTKSKRAVKWFKLMLDYINENQENEIILNYQKDTENSKKLGLAESYEEIGAFYEEIAGQIKQGKDDGAYKNLFWNLQNLMDKLTTKDREKTMIVRLELLEMVRYSLHRYATDFKRDGIEETSAKSLYKRVQNVLNTIDLDKTHPLYSKFEEIKANMEDTENAIQNAYGTTVKETEGEETTGKETEIP